MNQTKSQKKIEKNRKNIAKIQKMIYDTKVK